MIGLFPNLNKLIPDIILLEFFSKSIFNLLKSSSKFACFFIDDNFELKSSKLLTLNKSNINLYLLFRSKEVLALSIFSKLNRKIFQKINLPHGHD